MIIKAVCVLLIVSTCKTSAAGPTGGKIATLGLYEGDVCKEEQGVLWTCKKFMECPKAVTDYQLSKKITTPCSYQGSVDTLVVCCDTGTKAIASTSKSQEMCKKYAKKVYITKSGGFFNDDIEEDTCAASEPLIAFGQDAEPREFPHMALIGVGPKDAIEWGCGGSLISERFVLSAAHCSSFKGKRPAEWARLGEYNMKSKEDNYEGKANPEDYRIAQIIKHHGWKPPSLYDDIVLFKLEKDVTFNEFVRPACLQTKHNFPKTYAVATGWGKTEETASLNTGSDILMKVNLTLIQRTDCFKHYAPAMRGSKLKKGIKDESMLCAGDLVTKKDACQGDSGGPLQLRLKDPYCMYSVIGIVSFGPTACGEGGVPGVYTRVSHYIPWIEGIVWP